MDDLKLFNCNYKWPRAVASGPAGPVLAGPLFCN